MTDDPTPHGPDWARRLQALDSAHYLHPFTDSKALAARGARIIVRGEGYHVWDAQGQRLLDAMSGLWCVNVGYGRRELADAAHAQMMTLAYYNSFFNTTNEPAVELAARLCELAPGPAGRRFSHVFFTGSGSESNDTNIRLVRHYWASQGQPERQIIISRRNAYHGSTMGGASLGGMAGMHAQGGLPIPGIVHIDEPNALANALPGESAHDFGLRMARQLEDQILALGPEQVAAFIGEPVQGAGGVIVPPASYWPEIQRICDTYGLLLISDEVICGFGRLGHWFGYEAMGFQPDLVTFAKGVTSGYVPLGGVLVGERVAKGLIEQGGEFQHGYTYSGHPVACQVALANLDILTREHLLEQVRTHSGPCLARAYEGLLQHPLVGQVQTCGMTAALVLMQDPARQIRFAPQWTVGMRCRAHCFDNGLVMRAVGDRMIIAPPLIMRAPDIDLLMARIRHCLDLTLAELHAVGALSSA
ncbi:MAG: hypothetical protein RIQ97_2686 [Pseudomonadota bacterium]|jgi:putrescine aminotransferase